MNRDIVVEAIEKGVVTNITSSGMRGTLEMPSATAVRWRRTSYFPFTWNRARAIEAGDIKINVAFLGVPNADEMGNANGMDDAAFGSLGLRPMDAQYADTLVLVTDTIKPYPKHLHQSSKRKNWLRRKGLMLGDPDKIGSGATRFTI